MPPLVLDIGPTTSVERTSSLQAWIPHPPCHIVWQLSANPMLGVLGVLRILVARLGALPGSIGLGSCYVAVRAPLDGGSCRGPTRRLRRTWMPTALLPGRLRTACFG